MPAGFLTLLGIVTGGFGATAVGLAAADAVERDIKEKKDRIDARIAKNCPDPDRQGLPPVPPVRPQVSKGQPFGRGRDLVGAQRRRLERIEQAAREAHEAQMREAERIAQAQAEAARAAQTAQVFVESPSDYAGVDPEEAFVMWLNQSIFVTGNEYDRIGDVELFDSYTNYCSNNNYHTLHPKEVLQGLLIYGQTMGFTLVDRADGGGWEMVYAQLN